ncbi:MAG: flagellar hook-length control protein FliK [Lachnospiraceae bacterium]|jgi:flagellar hook-length control protein FliK|nr:flagellar hook-length control protein FliK [Lachnospiraceae bacterium]
MTGAAVAGIRGFADFTQTAMTGAGRDKGDAFEAILQKQENLHTSSDTTWVKSSKQSERLSQEDSTDQTQDAQSTKDPAEETNQARRSEETSSPQEVVEPKEGTQPIEASEQGELTESDLDAQEAVQEMLLGILAQLQKQLMELTGLTQEQMEALLQDLGMESTELLDVGKLATFLLATQGESDPLSLTTNEALYETFLQISGNLKENLEAAAQSLGITKEELADLLKQIQFNEPTENVTQTESLQDLSLVDASEATQEGYTQDESQTIREEGTTQTAHQAQSSINELSARQETGQESGQDTSRSGHKDTQPTTENPTMVPDQGTIFVASDTATPYVSQSLSTSQNVDTEFIMRQIVEYVKGNVTAESSSVEMQLNPENLGTLRIILATKDGALTAQFFTQNEAVKNALETQMIRLMESFEEQGISVTEVEVSVATHEFDMGSEQEQQSNAQSGSGNEGSLPRHRSLVLEDILSPGYIASAQEQLAADMMIANGNTVDYTV